MQDDGKETEKKERPAQRCIIESANPLGSQCSILLVFLRRLMQRVSELATRGTKGKNFSTDSSLPFVEGSLLDDNTPCTFKFYIPECQVCSHGYLSCAAETEKP